MTSQAPGSSVAGPRAQPSAGSADAAAGSHAAGMATAGAAIELKNVRRTYPIKRGRERGTLIALEDISLTVPAGQQVALLGPNGSGKSTLLRIMATLDRPDADAGPAPVIRLLGEDAAGDPRRVRARLGVVFQTSGLDGLLSIQENLLTQASLFGMRGEAARARISWAAQRLGLTDRLLDRVNTLSGGLMRRADLARALLHDPDLLLLDEPTTGLDPRAREDFLATVQAVAGESRAAGRPRMTVVMSTHLMEEASRAERVVLLHRGRIIADEAPDTLRRRVGGVIIRCHAADELATTAMEILTRAGMSVAPPRADSTLIIASVPQGRDGLEEALVGLTRAEIPFEVGPPTLGDVFLSLTGEEMHAGDAGAGNGQAPYTPPHRGRMKRARA